MLVMKYLVLSLVLLSLTACTPEKSPRPEYVLVIHGGAGVMDRKDFTPELEKPTWINCRKRSTAAQPFWKPAAPPWMR